MNAFDGVRAAASGLALSKGDYGVKMFLEDFPQFCGEDGAFIGPAHMLDSFTADASASISPDRWHHKWRYACGLYTAHNATLYLRTFAESAQTPQQAAATGATVGIVKSATLGDSAVTYDTSAIVAGTEKWGGLNATQYGQILATEARLIGMGGTFVI